MNTLRKLFALMLLTGLIFQCSPPEESETAAPEVVEQNGSSTKKSTTCEITCPHCGYKKAETLPTDVCQIKYQCESCQKVLTPLEGDCCVFCSYGTHKCPSMQED